MDQQNKNLGSNDQNSESNDQNSESNDQNSESNEKSKNKKQENNFSNKLGFNSLFISMFCGSLFNLPAVSKTIDGLIGTLSVGQLAYGIVTWVTDDKLTSVGYLSGCIFSGLTLFLLRKNRLQASMQQSVNVLKEENDELKENNEELKENIDDLESVSNKLSEDLKMLKETIGLFDQNSDDVIENLREIYTSLKKENEVHAKLNKNMIHINILQIIRHFDSSTTFSLQLNDLEKAKKTLLNAFPNLNYNLLLTKIKENNKITAKNIYESIKEKQ